MNIKLNLTWCLYYLRHKLCLICEIFYSKKISWYDFFKWSFVESIRQFEGVNSCIKFEKLHSPDIDECAGPNPPCQQVCKNTVGSYTCECNPGFAVNPQEITQCDGEYFAFFLYLFPTNLEKKNFSVLPDFFDWSRIFDSFSKFTSILCICQYQYFSLALLVVIICPIIYKDPKLLV